VPRERVDAARVPPPGKWCHPFAGPWIGIDCPDGTPCDGEKCPLAWLSQERADVMTATQKVHTDGRAR
jgi:hypothetical protein